MVNKTITLACAGLLLAATGVWAQNVGDGLEPLPDESTTRVGTRGANFLEIPVGARGQALGASGAALIDGAEGLVWNVASATSVETYSLAFSYTELYGDADIDHFFAGAVFALNDVSAIGITVINLNSGDIIRTTEDFPEGGDPQFGTFFSYSGFSGMLSYSRAITDRLSVGLGLKLVTEGIDNAKATWVGGDVGVLFRTGLVGTTLGATIQHIGGDAQYSGSAIERTVAAVADVFPTGDNVPIAFNTRSLTLPTAFRFSVVADVIGSPEAWIQTAGTTSKLVLVVDVYDSIDTPVVPSVGLEYNDREIIYGRLGKRWLNEANADFRDFGDGVGLGAGLRIPVLNRNLIFDYAYTNAGILDSNQTFSFSFGS